MAWDLKDSGITLADIEGNELTNKTITIITPGNMPEDTAIDATYIPVVRNVDVNPIGN